MSAPRLSPFRTDIQASMSPFPDSRCASRMASSRDIFGTSFSRQRLTVDLLTPATFATLVVPISVIWLCSQVSIRRASEMLRAIDFSICDTSSWCWAACQAALCSVGGRTSSIPTPAPCRLSTATIFLH